MITRTKARDQGIEVSANATDSAKSKNAVNDALSPPPSKMSPSSSPYSLSKEDETVESVEGSSLSITEGKTYQELVEAAEEQNKLEEGKGGDVNDKNAQVAGDMEAIEGWEEGEGDDENGSIAGRKSSLSGYLLGRTSETSVMPLSNNGRTSNIAGDDDLANERNSDGNLQVDHSTPTTRLDDIHVNLSQRRSHVNIRQRSSSRTQRSTGRPSQQSERPSYPPSRRSNVSNNLSHISSSSEESLLGASWSPILGSSVNSSFGDTINSFKSIQSVERCSKSLEEVPESHSKMMHDSLEEEVRMSSSMKSITVSHKAKRSSKQSDENERSLSSVLSWNANLSESTNSASLGKSIRASAKTGDIENETDLTTHSKEKSIKSKPQSVNSPLNLKSPSNLKSPGAKRTKAKSPVRSPPRKSTGTKRNKSKSPVRLPVLSPLMDMSPIQRTRSLSPPNGSLKCGGGIENDDEKTSNTLSPLKSPGAKRRKSKSPVRSPVRSPLMDISPNHRRKSLSPPKSSSKCGGGTEKDADKMNKTLSPNTRYSEQHMGSRHVFLPSPDLETGRGNKNCVDQMSESLSPNSRYSEQHMKQVSTRSDHLSPTRAKSPGKKGTTSSLGGDASLERRKSMCDSSVESRKRVSWPSTLNNSFSIFDEQHSKENESTEICNSASEIQGGSHHNENTLDARKMPSESKDISPFVKHKSVRSPLPTPNSQRREVKRYRASIPVANHLTYDELEVSMERNENHCEIDNEKEPVRTSAASESLRLPLNQDESQIVEGEESVLPPSPKIEFEFPRTIPRPSVSTFRLFHDQAVANGTKSHQYQLDRAGTDLLSLHEVILPSIAYETNNVLKKHQSKAQRAVLDGLPAHQGKDVVEAIELCRKFVTKCTMRAMEAAGEAWRGREQKREQLQLERREKEEEERIRQEKEAKKQRKEQRARSRQLRYERQKREKMKNHPKNKEMWREVVRLMTDIQQLEKEERMWQKAMEEVEAMERHFQPPKKIELDSINEEGDDSVSKEIENVNVESTATTLVQDVTVATERTNWMLQSVTRAMEQSDKLREEAFEKYQTEHKHHGYPKYGDSKGVVMELGYK